MSDDSTAEQLDTLAKLAASREEIRRLLDPPPPPELPASGAEGVAAEPGAGAFPRSRTMKLLMSGRGLGTAGALLGGLLLARPALALRLLRLFPTRTVGRLLLVKAITLLRARQT